MSTLFATVFPDPSRAEEAQRLVQKLGEERVLRLASSVVIAKDNDGQLSRHGAHSPGALGGAIGGILGGILGLVGGPVVSAMGAASGAMSGGWFDLRKSEDRQIFMREVADKMTANHAALLGEVIDPSDEAKRVVEEKLTALGGTMVGKSPE